MRLFQTMKNWLQTIVSQIKERREEKRKRNLNKLSCTDINVVEFSGRLYIAYLGTPIVRIEDLKIKAPELLSKSRKDYLMWKELFDK